jgi:predicted DNA-binding antitoxin AbrB/MazE fold protein
MIKSTIKVKAKYENNVLKPLEKLALAEGEEVEIEIQTSVVNRTYAVSKLSDDVIENIIVTTESGE